MRQQIGKSFRQEARGLGVPLYVGCCGASEIPNPERLARISSWPSYVAGVMGDSVIEQGRPDVVVGLVKESFFPAFVAHAISFGGTGRILKLLSNDEHWRTENGSSGQPKDQQPCDTLFFNPVRPVLVSGSGVAPEYGCAFTLQFEEDRSFLSEKVVFIAVLILESLQETRALIDAVEYLGGRVMGVGCIYDRTGMVDPAIVCLRKTHGHPVLVQ